MGAYDRYKKDPNGFRRLVELLESTPMKRRQELIDRGMQEDPTYTKAAVEYIITFQDVLQLPEMELTEVLSNMKAKNVAFCAHKLEGAEREKFLGCVQKSRVIEVHSYLEMTPGAVEAGGAKKEAITEARKLEQKGLLSIKKIPKSFSTKEAPKVKKGRPMGDIDADPFAEGKDLFTDGLFGDDSDVIGKKKAS